MPGGDGNGAVRFGNTATGTVVVITGGHLTGQPQLSVFDTGVAGPSIPLIDRDATRRFGNASGSPMAIRIDGDLSATPTITLTTPVQLSRNRARRVIPQPPQYDGPAQRRKGPGGDRDIGVR